MSVIGAYARALAASAGRAQPIASVRHLYLAPAPLVVVPLAMAGEANAPLAVMVGTAPEDSRLLVVHRPRERRARFLFADELARVVLGEIERCAAGGAEAVKPPRAAKPAPDDGAGPETPVPEERTRFLDAPQILVPNRAGIDFLRLLGRSTRFRSPVGEYPVPPLVPLLGCWLTQFARRAEHPGSSALVAMTEALAAHWASGQSALEDANLAALMAWIDPPPGQSGAQAARRAEDPEQSPPAGPATDPRFDNRVLAPALRGYEETLNRALEDNGAGEADPAVAAAAAAVDEAVRGQLEPTWQLMWQAVGLLRGLPEAASVPARWERDRASFSAYHAQVTSGEGHLPQPRRDSAVAAARRLGQLERELAEFEANRAFDDPLVLANQRVSGEAFAGTVAAVDRDRRVTSDRGRLVTRPVVEVDTPDPVRLARHTRVESPGRRRQIAVVRDVRPTLAGSRVELEITNGMGNGRVPREGSVPEPGEAIAYTSLIVEGPFGPSLPAPEDTPWTHGGPPAPYEPTDADTAESWE